MTFWVTKSAVKQSSEQGDHHHLLLEISSGLEVGSAQALLLLPRDKASRKKRRGRDIADAPPFQLILLQFFKVLLMHNVGSQELRDAQNVSDGLNKLYNYVRFL